MTETKLTSALAAFGFLLEAIEDEVEIVNRAGASAFDKGDHESTRTALNRADQLKEIRHKVAALRDEWELVLPVDSPIEPTAEGLNGVEGQAMKRPKHGSYNGRGRRRRNGFEGQAMKRLRRGICTPVKEYDKPILVAVIESGGSAKAEDVLTRVKQLMRTILKPVDYEFINSGKERWRKEANWVRHSLVKRGLLKSNSPRGIWEISDMGRQFLDSSNRGHQSLR